MLSFLREQSFEDLPAEKASGAAAGHGDGSKDASDQPFITVATNSRLVRRSTTVLAVLLVAGVLCIWFMVRKTSPQGADAALTDVNEADIAAAIYRVTGAKEVMFGKMDEIVNKFYEFSRVLQVEVNELVKNPFELEMFLASLEGDINQAVQVDPAVIRRRKIEQKAEALSLLSIMRSDQGSCCMINNKFLYQGDSIDGFRVSEIGSDFVKLFWDSKDDSAASMGREKVEIILKLSEE